MTPDCNATVHVESWEQNGSTLTTTFLVTVDHCARSYGEFEYVVTFKTSSGAEKEKRWTGAWPRQDTTNPIYPTDTRSFSEQVVSVDAIENATKCDC